MAATAESIPTGAVRALGRRSIAELVQNRPDRRRLLDQAGLLLTEADMTLEELCAEHHVDLGPICGHLLSLDGEAEEEPSTPVVGISTLLKEHDELRCELQRIERSLTRLALSYGLDFASLRQIAVVFVEVRQSALAAFWEEETHWFPCATGGLLVDPVHWKRQRSAVRTQWERLRSATDNYRGDGPEAPWATLLGDLRELDRRFACHHAHEDRVLAIKERERDEWPSGRRRRS